MMFLFVPFIMMAQTSSNPKAITSDQDYYYAYSDTLEKDDTISQYYYIKDYCQDLRIQVNMDTLAAGYLKANTVVYGSLDYSNWSALTGDITGTALSATFAADSTITGTNTYSGTSTISTAGTTSATSTTLFKDVYYKYIKVTTIAIDSTQYGDFDYRILFNTNE